MTLFESEPEEVSGDPYFEDLPPDPVSESQARSTAHGKEFDLEALELLEALGARVLETKVVIDGYRIDAVVEGPNCTRFLIDGHGTPDREDRKQAGIRRTDTIYKFGFKALRLHAHGHGPLILLTSHLPKPKSASAYVLTEIAHVLFDVIATTGDFAGQQRLRHYLHDEPAPTQPLPAPWRDQHDAETQVQLSMAFDDLEDEE